jgi:hypothetical protein
VHCIATYYCEQHSPVSHLYKASNSITRSTTSPVFTFTPSRTCLPAVLNHGISETCLLNASCPHASHSRHRLPGILTRSVDHAQAVSVQSSTFSLTDKLTHSPCSERTLKPKHESETSSFGFRRYATQPISEDPFSAFDNSFTRNHEELAAFGSWARCHDSALQYGNALHC